MKQAIMYNMVQKLLERHKILIRASKQTVIQYKSVKDHQTLHEKWKEKVVRLLT